MSDNTPIELRIYAAADAPTVTQADVEAAREIILKATATDLLYGERRVVKQDRSTVYGWLIRAQGLLAGTVSLGTRRTRLGELPVNVTTIDMLDDALTRANEASIRQANEMLRLRSELSSLRIETAAAVRYAEARIALEDPDAVAFMTHEEMAAAKIALKRARKDYFDAIERETT